MYPPTPLSPQTIHSTVRKIHALIPLYPPRFPDIEAAKTYISNICASKHLPLPPHDQDKITFLVAIRAFEAGEFYLTTPLPDRKALRAAIETHIARIIPLIQTWPTHFSNATDAQKWIARSVDVEDSAFEGVQSDKFRGYVTYNAARKAWEEGWFEMCVVPRGWVRKTMMQASRRSRSLASTSVSLSAAVEIDLTRLAPLLPPWPPHFAHLNAARDHVRGVCYGLHFIYTYHPDVESPKFRCFVQYNTAKKAWEAGAFEVGESERAGGDREDKICNARMEECLGESAEKVEAGVFRVSKKAYGVKVAKDAHSDLFAHGSQSFAANFVGEAAAHPTHTSLLDVSDSSKETLEEPRRVAEEDNIEEEMVKEKIDPFKALVADLRREFILKAAFE